MFKDKELYLKELGAFTKVKCLARRNLNIVMLTQKTAD